MNRIASTRIPHEEAIGWGRMLNESLALSREFQAEGQVTSPVHKDRKKSSFPVILNMYLTYLYSGSPEKVN